MERPGLKRIRPPRELTRPAGRLRSATASLLRILGSMAGLLAARFSVRVFIVSIPDPLPIAICLFFLLRLSGAKIIYIVHDPLPHAFRLPKRWRWLELWAIGLSYDLATTIVVLSEASRQRLSEVFPHVHRPIEIIEHGVFPLEGCGEPPGDGKLLCFGTIRRNKHIAQAIEGIALARQDGLPASLLVAGETHKEDRAYEEECQRLARQAGAGVEWLPGYLDDAELPAIMARCDAFLLPYGDFHSQSGVAMLAASNGWPIIATDAGGLSALIEDGLPAQRIEQPVTAQSVARAVAAFMAAPIYTWQTSARAYRERVLERLSWTAIADRYLEVARSP
jgi:glycosyltransferase involved in cell wall biosynthesis